MSHSCMSTPSSGAPLGIHQVEAPGHPLCKACACPLASANRFTHALVAPLGDEPVTGRYLACMQVDLAQLYVMPEVGPASAGPGL